MNYGTCLVCQTVGRIFEVVLTLGNALSIDSCEEMTVLPDDLLVIVVWEMEKIFNIKYELLTLKKF